MYAALCCTLAEGARREVRKARFVNAGPDHPSGGILSPDIRHWTGLQREGEVYATCINAEW